jgi:hypothetical protein
MYTPLHRRQAIALGAAGLAGLVLKPQPLDAGFLDFLKRVARAVGIITGPGLIMKLLHSKSVDSALNNAVQKELNFLQKNGFSTSSVYYQTDGPSGLPGNRLMTGGFVPQPLQTGRLFRGGKAQILTVQNAPQDNREASLSSGLFFNQERSGFDPAVTNLIGPTLDGVLLAGEYVTKKEGIDIQTNPALVQRLLLPLRAHQVAGRHGYQSYDRPDMYDSAVGRVAVLYKSTNTDEGIVLVNVADKNAKLIYTRQFYLDFRRRTANGFPLQDEAPSTTLAKQLL